MSEHISSRPFVFLYIILCSVQILHSFMEPVIELNHFFALLAITCCVMIRYWQKVSVRISISLFVLALYFFIRIHIHYEQINHPAVLIENETFYEDLKLIVEKRETRNNKIFISGTPLYSKISGLVYLQLTKTEENLMIKVKDTIFCKAAITPLVKYSSKYFKSFDQYLYNQHIRYKAYSKDSSCLISVYNAFNIKRFADDLANSCSMALMYRSEDPVASSVIRALIIGDKSELNSTTKLIFQQSGTAHVLAVSGLHMGILYILLNLVLTKVFKLSKTYNTPKSFIIISALWLFAFVVGLSPSAVRATIMISVYLLATPLKRKNNPVNTLFFCAFAMQFYDPCLAKDIGFQLSVVAVLSILIFNPLVDRILILRNTLLNYLWSSISLALSVQILILPLSLLYFQTFPVSFIVSNILWSPISFVSMGLGAASIAMFSIVPGISGVFNYLNEKMIAFGINGINFIQDHGATPISGLWITQFECVCFYIIIGLVFLGFHINLKKYIICGLLLLLGLSIEMIFKVKSDYSKPSLVLFYEKGKFHTEFIRKGISYTTLRHSFELNKYRSSKLVKEIIELNDDEMVLTLSRIGIELCEIQTKRHKSNHYKFKINQPISFKTLSIDKNKLSQEHKNMENFLKKYEDKEQIIDPKLLQLRPLLFK